jgi:hypothetical protein
MHYTILVFCCPYICFVTYSAIFWGVEQILITFNILYYDYLQFKSFNDSF